MGISVELAVCFILFVLVIAIFATLVMSFKKLSDILIENIWMHDLFKQLIEKKLQKKIVLDNYIVLKKGDGDRESVTYSCDHCHEDIAEDDVVHHLDYTLILGQNNEKKITKRADLCDRCLSRILTRMDSLSETLMKDLG